MPRRSGMTTVHVAASAAASGCHMSPVSAKPCSATTAGPLPPMRVWIVAPPVSICSMRKPAGKDCISKPLDQRLRGGRIAHLGAGNEIDEGVALLGPCLGLLGPL